MLGGGLGNMIFEAQFEGCEVKENVFYTFYTYDPSHPQTINMEEYSFQAKTFLEHYRQFLYVLSQVAKLVRTNM